MVFAFCSALCLGALKGSPSSLSFYLFKFYVVFFFVDIFVFGVYFVLYFLIIFLLIFLFHVNLIMGC